MREWLTVIIGLLILAVVLDGVRRMRHARRNSLRMPRGRSDSGTPEFDTYASELPNGGARVVKTRKPEDARQRHEEIRQSNESHPEDTNRVPEQVALNLDEHVPTLMEVEQQEAAAAQKRSPVQKKHRQPQAGTERIEPRMSIDEPAEELDEDHPDVVLGLVPSRDKLSYEDRNYDESPVFDDDEPQGGEDEYKDQSDISDDDTDRRANTDDFQEPEEVLVINIMAAPAQRLHGDILLDTVLEQGMRFGEMSIFHHHEKPNGSGALLYSMANMVVPGTFDLENMRDFSTPGVSLFLALPSQADSSLAFETMLKTAQAIAASQSGELKDENRSVMTAQTIEHYRSRIKEFERKQLSKAPL